MNGAKIESVGVIGLGKMGGQLARHLAAAGFETLGYDVRTEAMHGGRRRRRGGHRLAGRAGVGRAIWSIVGVGFDSRARSRRCSATGGVMESPKPGSVRRGRLDGRARHHAEDRRADRSEAGISVLDIPMARGEQAAIDGNLLIFGGERPRGVRSLPSRPSRRFPTPSTISARSARGRWASWSTT